MASCPPPPRSLPKPPDVAPIKFLAGKYETSGVRFFNPQTKRWTGAFYDMRSKAKVGEDGTGGARRDHRGETTAKAVSKIEWKDPVVRAVLAWMEKWAKKAWKMVAGDVKMTEMLDQNRPHDWTIRYGDLKALEPLPGETVGQYRARGGVPLVKNWLDGRRSIDRVLPSWVDKHDSQIEAFHLHIQWDGRLSRNMVLYTRIETPGKMDKVGDYIARAIRWACSKLTNDKLQSAAMYGLMYPSPEVQATIGVYMSLAAACNQAWPSCSLPSSTSPAGIIAPVQVSVIPTFPVGAIAWFDKKLGLYRIAVPRPLAGVEATHVEAQAVASVPATVPVVGRFAWENATRPLYQRTWFLITSGVATVGALAGGTAAILRRRHA